MVFIKNVIKNYLTIWSLAPSSRYLYNKMTRDIDFSNDIHIVEFWPWNWVFSDKLLKQMWKNSKISIFEIDANFCNYLRNKYKHESRVKIYEISACQTKNFFEENSIDYVISSLPLSFIEKNKVLDILEKTKLILKPNWKFIQYQYFLKNKKEIKKVFNNIKYNFTFLNFPPAFIYTCKK